MCARSHARERGRCGTYVEREHVAKEGEIFARVAAVFVAVNAARLNVVKVVDHHVRLAPARRVHLLRSVRGIT